MRLLPSRESVLCVPHTGGGGHSGGGGDDDGDDGDRAGFTNDVF